MIKFSAIAKITKGTLLGNRADGEIHELIIDSRKLPNTVGALFIAIKGVNHDGHQFASHLYALGVRHFVVSEKVKLPEDAAIILVENTTLALQQIAAEKRRNFKNTLIGITGSNGKTILKEWLFELLNAEMPVYRSPKSYNSQIGVPLSVWKLEPYFDVAIIEAGISTRGEMDKLEKIISPDIGIFTNIGSAHNEGFTSEKEKIAEKAILFKQAKCVIYCKDHPAIDEHFLATGQKTHTWSAKGAKADLQFNLQTTSAGVIAELLFQEQLISFSLPFADEAGIENSLHAICTCLYLGVDPGKLSKQIRHLHKINMRLVLKKGINQSYLIDDSYNNDPAGLRIALDFLSQQNHHAEKVLILSDMLQTGKEKEELYREISELVNGYKLSQVLLVGENISQYASYFENVIDCYTGTNEFLEQFDRKKIQQKTVLIKGARVFEFEKIVAAFQEQVHGTILEINLDALTHNLNYYRSLLPPKTKLMVMVKAFAYGTGLSEVANLLQYHRVDYLAVAYADEGAELRKSGIRLPIMVMNPTQETFDLLIQYQLEPVLYNHHILDEFVVYTTGKNAKTTIHLEIETGMNRLGFKELGLNSLIEKLTASQHLKIASIFSHLAAADEEQYEEFSHQQAQLFEKCYRSISDVLGYLPIKHLLNSPGIERFKEYTFDMVRLGIGLYGIDANNQHQDRLLPISTLKTTVSQINKVKKGESIGYGRKGKATEDMEIATIAIGYADGFSRAFSNGKGVVSINGHKAEVIGNVCMDMCMVNVTGINAGVGDEVVIFGEQLSIIELAKAIDTIPYEILTNVSERVKRVYYTE